MIFIFRQIFFENKKHVTFTTQQTKPEKFKEIDSLIKNPKAMSMKNTQLTQIENYNTSNLIFSKVQEFPIPGSDTGLVYKRISVGTVNPDGTKGDLIIKTPKCFSFGVSENINDNTGLVDGYSVPLCLKSRDGWAGTEKEFYDSFMEIIEAMKTHCLKEDVKEDMGKFDMVYTDLRKLDPIYRKKDKKGRIMDDAGPVLYPKALMNKKTGNMMTTFYEENKFNADGEPTEIDFKELVSNKIIKNYCYTTAALKIESIYVGQSLSLQVKVIEADVERMNNQKTFPPLCSRIRILDRNTSTPFLAPMSGATSSNTT